jgi:ATP-binding cassette subfamily B protein
MSKTQRPPLNIITADTLTFKKRISALTNLPELLRLVWKTSPGMTLGSCLIRLIRSALPVAILYIGKLIIDEVVGLNKALPGYSLNKVWQYVGIEFALAILSDFSGRAMLLLDSLLGDKFSNQSSVKIIEHAATLDLDQFEDSVFYDKLERARQQTVGRTVLLSQVMAQIQDIITISFFAVGVITFNPWLIVLLLITIIPSFLGDSYFNSQTYALTRGQTPERRELDYIRFLGASDETAKEIKIFNLSDFITDRFKTLSSKFYNDNKSLVIKRASWGTFFALIGSAGYYSAYAIIIYKTVTGHTSIGGLTFLAGSFRQMRTSLESILGRFTTISQGAIYLDDFFEFFKITPEIKQAPKPLPFPEQIKYGVTFENVGFKYRHSENWANRNLNFTLKAGEKLALVGENGAGKTTLVKLLARLYDPTEGRILLDNIDLKEYDLDDLRLNMGLYFKTISAIR